MTKQNLPVYGVPGGVNSYVQSKQAASKNKMKKLPESKFRLYENDIEPPCGALYN